MGNCIFPPKTGSRQKSECGNNDHQEAPLSRNREPSKIQERIKALEEASTYKKGGSGITKENLWETSSNCTSLLTDKSLKCTTTNTLKNEPRQGRGKSKRVKRQAPPPPAQDNCIPPAQKSKTEKESSDVSRNREPSKIEKRIKSLREASTYNKQGDSSLRKEKLWGTERNETTNEGCTVQVALIDTLSDSIQCLNFADNWFNSIFDSILVSENSIQTIIQFKINSSDSIQ